MNLLETVSDVELFRVCVVLECAHEPDDRKRAEDQLKEWGISHKECADELKKRGAL